MSESNETPENEVENSSENYQASIFEHLVGQKNVIAVLRTHLDAYWNDRMAGRKPRLTHMLFCGPSGTGKTQAAYVLAQEIAVPITVVTADALRTAQSCYAALMDLEDDAILFIDEVHAIKRFPVSETILLKALAEGRVSLGKLPRFTCIAATTDPWSLHAAFLQRFTILNFEFYTVAELAEIARRTARTKHINCEAGVLDALARRGKQTPRTCLALLDACHKTARSENTDTVTLAHVETTMSQLNIDELGLDSVERRYLQLLSDAGGCIRLHQLAMRMGLPVPSLQKIIEPFLVRQGLIAATDRGRELTRAGHAYIKPKKEVVI